MSEISQDCYPCSNRSGFILAKNCKRQDRVLIAMDPADFLTLASGGLAKLAQPELRDRPTDEFTGVVDPPFLIIDLDKGKVDGHEGRHRAITAIENRIQKIPVILMIRRWEYNFPPVLEAFKEYNICNVESETCRIEAEGSTDKLSIPFKPFEDPIKACEEWCR